MAVTPSSDTLASELRMLFFDETHDQLEQLNRGLLHLEHDAMPQPLLLDLLRIAHTVKGSTATAGLAACASTMHAMEDVLSALQRGTIDVHGDIIDTLLRAIDQVHRALTHAQQGTVPEATRLCEEVLPSLLALRATQAAPVKVQPPASHPPVSPLPDTHCCLLVNFSNECAMPAPRAFLLLRALERIGTLVRSEPTRDDLLQGKINHRLLVILATSATHQEISAQVERVGEVEWVRVARGAQAAGMRLDMSARERAVSPAKQAGLPGVDFTNQSVRLSTETIRQMLDLADELHAKQEAQSTYSSHLQAWYPHDPAVTQLVSISSDIIVTIRQLQGMLQTAQKLPIGELLRRFPRVVRDLCRELGKEVELQLVGTETLVDRAILDRLSDPVIHLLRNAVDHGIETADERSAHGKPSCGLVRISARTTDTDFTVCIADDGAGIRRDRLLDRAITAGILDHDAAATLPDEDILGLLFTPGISTAITVSNISGRGVGMDIVKHTVEDLGGHVTIESEPGKGTTFLIRIPIMSTPYDASTQTAGR